MNEKIKYKSHTEGSPRGNPYDLTYSPSGRLIGKFRDNNSVTLSATVDMAYGYCDDYQPHAVKRMFDYAKEMHYDLRWDESGNLGQVSIANKDAVFERGRFLYWTEDNRLHTVADDRYYSYYTYDHSGERRLKLTGENDLLDVNADYMETFSILNNHTLYPSAYMVLTDRGYTKHYYAGTERVAARIGGGGLNALCSPIGQNRRVSLKAGLLFAQSSEQVNNRELQENDLECVNSNDFSQEEFMREINEIPYLLQAKAEIDNSDFYEMIRAMVDDPNDGREEEVYFYHSDHLGSASWITDIGGEAVQHLHYLPFGERYIDQRMSGYNERFTFTGKERDEETGYGYFGARYMDHELMTMWLSVDPMADKYPSISPYAYCTWNPVKLVDPDGRDIYHFNNDGSFSHKTKAKGAHKGEIMYKGETVSFSFADPVNDPKSIEEGTIQKLDIVSNDRIKEYLNKAGVYDMKRHNWKDKISYLINESNASDIGGAGKLDYVVTADQHGLNPSTLYLTEVDGENVAHNNYNFGNFLWGASTKELGVVSIVARGAAHINNFFNDCENVTRKFWERKFDSKDDQRSIQLGIQWARKN